MKKCILLIVSLLLLTSQTVAQHYEWVRNFTAGHKVVGSTTDSLGNIYVLGTWGALQQVHDGTILIPDFPHDTVYDTTITLGVTLIVKISPEGDVVWHKIIYGSASLSVPHDIKPLGDSAFTCLITMPLATQTKYLYYLDTMIYEGSRGLGYQGPTIPWPNYPISAQQLRDPQCLALITFDFDGNVLDQHFLQMSYLDTLGEDIQRTYPVEAGAGTQPWLQNNTIRYPAFAIDIHGNIYLSHWTYNIMGVGPEHPNDFYTVEDGTISALKFWCDRREVGIVPTDSSLATSPQILKFSPHFDTLLESRYVFQKGTRIGDYFYTNYLQTDKSDSNNLYYLNTITFQYPDERDYIIDSTNGLYVHQALYNQSKGFLVRFDSDLSAVATISLDDSLLCNEPSHSNTGFYDIEFDYDNNLLFLTAVTGRGYRGDTTHFNTVHLCQGIPLPNLKDDAFFMAFKTDVDTLPFYSYGGVNSIYGSDYYRPGVLESRMNHLACSNNRVFLQSNVYGGVCFPGQAFDFGNVSTQGRCITIFDYHGTVIGGIFYTGSSTYSVAVRDSILYFVDKIHSSSATFDDIIIPYTTSTFIAKYIDTSFTWEYTNVTIKVVDENLTVVHYPNPTTGRLTIDMNGRPLREAWVAAINGIVEPLPVKHLGDSRYAADLTGRPDGAYILILVADDHRTYRSTVILQH